MSNKNLSIDENDEVSLDNRANRENDVGSSSRGTDNRMSSNEKPIKVTLEFINEVILDYLTNIIGPSVNENNQLMKVPVMYGNPERWSTARRDGVIRDETTSKLLTPLIMIRRVNVSRAPHANPNNKYMYMALSNKWNPRNAYDKHAVINRVTPSRSLMAVMVPDYVDLTYEVLIWTNYQEQMDEIIEQINIEADEYWGVKNNYKFRVKIDEFQSNTELPPSQDRVVRTSFTMKIGAYLVPEKMISNFKMSSTNFKTYTAKKTVVFDEIL